MKFNWDTYLLVEVKLLKEESIRTENNYLNNKNCQK